jgi:hypothetical protein
MEKRVAAEIKKMDFIFENSSVMVIANRNSSEIKLAGLSLGPFEEGNEYEIYRWAALELQKSGMVHFREDEGMDSAKLNKIIFPLFAYFVSGIIKIEFQILERLINHLSESARAYQATPP